MRQDLGHELGNAHHLLDVIEHQAGDGHAVDRSTACRAGVTPLERNVQRAGNVPAPSEGSVTAANGTKTAPSSSSMPSSRGQMQAEPGLARCRPAPSGEPCPGASGLGAPRREPPRPRSATSRTASSRPRSGVAARHVAVGAPGCATRGRACAGREQFTWKMRSGSARSFQRVSRPDPGAATPAGRGSRRRPCRSESTICSPWAVESSRATRFSAGPKKSPPRASASSV